MTAFAVAMFALTLLAGGLIGYAVALRHTTPRAAAYDLDEGLWP